MSDWTHACCEDCWIKREPLRSPNRMVPEFRVAEKCGWCGQVTLSGIYVRQDPATTPYPSSYE